MNEQTVSDFRQNTHSSHLQVIDDETQQNQQIRPAQKKVLVVGQSQIGAAYEQSSQKSLNETDDSIPNLEVTGFLFQKDLQEARKSHNVVALNSKNNNYENKAAESSA